MITCQHARHLFDSYLDGELSANLQTELHAHRLNCTSCQNELALLEACGDVIAMDRREPQLSISFTDRVLMARRGRQMPSRRKWGRTFWLVGSPLAAAASVAFTLFVIAPQNPPKPKPEVATYVEVVPEQVRDVLLQQKGRELTPEEKQEIARGHEMTTINFVESVLAPLVEHSKNTLDGTRRGAEELELLMRMGLSNTNEVLVARWRSMEQEKKAAAAMQERLESQLDPSDPSYFSQPPAASESAGESDWDGPVEAL